MIADENFKIALTGDIDFTTAMLGRNDPLVWRWCRQYTAISPDEQDAWRDRILDPSIKMFSVRFEARQIGVAGFTSIDRQNRSAEFSLWLQPGCQNKGFGRQALFLLIRHGFYDWGFHRIWGEVYEGNPALLLFLKMGFEECGVWRESYFRRGEWINSHLIDYLARDFEDEPKRWT